MQKDKKSVEAAEQTGQPADVTAQIKKGASPSNQPAKAADHAGPTIKEAPPHDHSPFGLVGHPLGHSWSPQIHEALGSVPYALHDLAPEEVASFVRDGSWEGLNVTIPYKPDAACLADEVSPRVERLGVANTLVHQPDGSIFAENTDVLGFAWLLDEFCRKHLGGAAAEVLAGKPVLVCGNGGASQAVQAALAETGAQVSAVDIVGDDTYDTLLERHPKAFLVVNTTPVGMFPKCPSSVLSLDTLRQLEPAGVLDVVYNPTRTGICLAAEKLGIPSQSGLTMLVAQALFSSELFQHKQLDRSLIAQVEQGILHQTMNVCLIGMPGSGKTTTGRKLARLMSRPFVDLDEAFALEYAVTAEQCIRAEGEAHFRELETKLIAKYGARSGLVIACGGGVVTQPQNYDLLHQNGVIFTLDRPLDQLSVDGRPISQAKGIQKLAQERLPLYHQWADYAIHCTGTPQGDAEQALSLLGW